MFHKFLLLFACSSLLLGINNMSVSAQPCADTQPTIAGAQIVVNNQDSVIYSTPNIPGHTYSWTVTGGLILAGANTSQIIVRWDLVGTGSVTVTETNPSIPCFSVMTKTIKVQPLLVSYFYYRDTATACYGADVAFTDTSVYDVAKPIVNYFIDFGDGTPPYNSPVRPFRYIHSFPLPYNVTHTVTYIVTNSEGMNDTIYDAIYVNPYQYIPVAAFNFIRPNCSYQTVTFDGTVSTTPPGSGPMEIYAWDFGDPASGAANIDSCGTCTNPSHLFTGPGVYNVHLKVMNYKGCIRDTTEVVVIDQSVPTAKFAFSAPTCQNNPVNFTDQSTFPAGKDITTWEWNFGDGTMPVTVNAPAIPNVNHIFPALGPYTVQLIVTNNLGCQDTSYHTVTLTPSPIADFMFGVPCAGDTMKFTNTSKLNNGPAIVTHTWDYGDPLSGNNFSNQVNGAHVYNIAGDYWVTLAITNTTGCPDTIRKQFHINAKPTCNFTFNVGALNNEIQFHIDSTTPGLTNLGAIGYMCNWNFGDGTYGIGHNPIHTYLGSNNWTASLTVTDTNGCSGTIAHIVYVPEIPMAFYSSNSPVCLNTPMCFIDLSSVPSPPFGFINKWVWDFNDGTPPDTILFPLNPDVCHTYLNPGTYAVKLSVTDNSGFTDSYTHDQIVLPLPIANFQWSTPCEGKLVQFTDASFSNGSGNIIDWKWNFGDPSSGVNNLSSLTDPTHIFTDSGYFSVRLIVQTFNGCFDTMIRQVYVFPSPPVDFTRDTACLGDLVHFFTNTVITHTDSIVTWLWDFGDGIGTSTAPINTSYLYTAPGTYIASLTVVDAHGCTNTVSHTVKVNPKPIPEFSWTSPACSGSVIQFTDQSVVPAGYTGYVAKWVWDFGDNTGATITFPGTPSVTHVFPTTNNTWVVRLTIWSSDSCTQFIEHTITLIPSPIADFTIDPVTCQGQAVQFHDFSQTNGGGSLTQWHWNFGDPTSGQNTLTIQNPTHTYAAWGTYTVTLITQNATGCSDTIAKTITVNQLPVADFTATSVCLNQITTFTSTSTANAATIVSYFWEFGDGITSPMQNPPHTYGTYGIFNVKLTIVNSNGCIKDTTKQVIVHPLPIPQFSFSSANCLGAVVHYTDLSHTVTGYLGSIASWEWNFQDGFDTIIFAPGVPDINHIFIGGPLNHLVRLTITSSDGCTAFIEHLVTSIPGPIANFSFQSQTCADQAVLFHDNTQQNGGGLITAWHWDFGDPITGGSNFAYSPDPIHLFSAPGPFTVQLIVTNTDGCQDTITRIVNVAMLPVAKFVADTACFNSPTTFSSATSVPNAASIIAWHWDFGDGLGSSSSLQNPTFTYLSYGPFNVTLTITNSNGCIKDTTIAILVNPLPVSAFTFTSPNCTGSVVHFTNQSTTVLGYLGSIVKWVWNFNDGTPIQTILTPFNPSINHTFPGPGTSFTVRLTVTTSDSCTAFIEHVVNLMPAPLANFSFPPSNCADQNIQFTDLTAEQGGGPIATWEWNFSDPLSGPNNNSTLQSPVHVFLGPPGPYIVRLIVHNGTNCTDTSIQTVTIIAKPVADFTSDVACQGTLTSFTDQSTASGTITQHNWDFGDGVGTSNQMNPQYLYPSAGTYNVTLIVTTNEGCIGVITKTVTVLGKPIALFTASSPTCAGSDSVHFHNLSTTPHGLISTWDWNFGDGSANVIRTFPANADVSHLYLSGGNYPVTLTITTSDTCIALKTITIQVESAPAANFFWDALLCVGQSVQFHDQTQTGGGSNLNQWLWNFDDPNSGVANTSNVQNATHKFTHSGTFSVNLMVTNATGCHDSLSKNVTINAAPLAKFGADTSCIGSLTTFTDQSVANSGTLTAWNWDFGDPSSITNTSTLQNPTHTYNAPGSYGVRLSVTNSNSCIHDTVITITVNPKPQAMFQASVACMADSTAFTDLSIAPGSAVTGWDWDFGDNSTHATIQNPKHKYTTAATFNVTLIVTNLSGCQDTITIPIIVRPKPVAAFAYTSFFCPAGQIAFQDQSTGTGSAIVQREWIFFPGSTSSLINPIFVFPVTDTTYLIQLIVTDSYGCMDTVADSVHVKPGFKFTFTNDTVCFKDVTHFFAHDLAQGDSLYNVSWNFGDPDSGPNNNVSGFNATHTFTQAGTYVVKMKATDSDNCSDSIFHEVTVHALPTPAFTFVSLPCDSVIHFHDGSGWGSGSVASWDWNFGDGSPDLIIPATAGSGDTSHIYGALGVYPVTLKVTNTFGCSDTIIRNAEYFPCIFAGFSYLDTLTCARYSIALSDSSFPVNIINQWHWVFGDGSPDTIYTMHAGVIHHTFANPGSYGVQLIIHATVGSGRTFVDTTTHAITIHPTPMPYFSNVSTCKKQTTFFRDTSNTFGSATTSWKWTFGETWAGLKDTSSFRNPSFTYDSAGTYNVKMVVMNIFGCKDSLTKATRVFEIPTASFDHSIACSGNPTYFTDKSLKADTTLSKWFWNFGEPTANKDTSELQNPSHQYKTEGLYQAQLIVKDRNGCYDTADSSITVHVTPVSSFTYTDNITNMTGKLQFTNKSSGADTYFWDFGNGQTSTEDNPVVTYAYDGSFIIMLISNNQYNCTDTTYFKYEFIFKGLYIPNAFAPSSQTSGANIFAPVGVNLKQYKIEVFDNWGHLMWTSTELDALGRPTETWNGKDQNGVLLSAGTFMWKAKATFIDNSEWPGSDIGKGGFKTFGTVTLIR